MEQITHKEHFLASLERCTSNEDFIPSFYDRFLSSNEEIRRKFDRVDFDHQNQMLLRSLQLAAGATSGDPESLKEIQTRGESHDRRHLNIELCHYEHWLESVIETAKEFDAEWANPIEESWRSILGFVIKHMIKMY
jgi:hemoglobin-like flavoprotein